MSRDAFGGRGMRRGHRVARGGCRRGTDRPAGRSLRRAGRGSAVRAWAALLLVLTGGACTPLDDAMVAIFGRSMRDSRALDPYENPRMPADGAVPFAVGNYPAQLDGADPYAPGLLPPFAPAEMSPPGSERVRSLENPVAADDASLDRGRVVYDRYCAVCHGPQGLSAAAPVIEKLPVMAAWNLAVGNPVTYSDGYIFAMIREGRGGMPAYGHRIPYIDRWHVVNYVRYLQQQQTGGSAASGTDGPPPSDTAGAAPGGEG